MIEKQRPRTEITVSQAAKFYNRSTPTIRRWCSDGLLKIHAWASLKPLNTFSFLIDEVTSVLQRPIVNGDSLRNHPHQATYRPVSLSDCRGRNSLYAFLVNRDAAEGTRGRGVDTVALRERGTVDSRLRSR
jgi:hypothetical protein